MDMFKQATFLGILLVGAAISTPARAADYVSPSVGGAGGTAYSRDCGANAALVGLQGRFGMWIDQLTPVCQAISSNGALGQIFTQARIGGSGGSTAAEARCSTGKVVTGARVRWGAYIDRLNLLCATWDPATKSARNDGQLMQFLGRGDSIAQSTDLACPTGQVGKGLKGKAALYVDSLALICNVWNQ